MKQIRYGKPDFPTGFHSGLLLNSLVTAHGKSFELTSSEDSVLLTLDDVDNEIPIRTTCTTHFALTPAARDSAWLDMQTDGYFNNGDKSKRFTLDILYRIDQRLRILEAAPAITKLQFFNGLKNIYKNI